MKFGLRHIRYFIAVAEEEHFRRASERLHIAQPALTRAIQHLERELNVTLFDRANRRIHITEAGKTFLAGCKSLMANMEATVENTRQVDAGKIGALRIGYTDIAIAGTLPRLLKDFQEREPGITMKPHHSVTTDQLERLKNGTLDFGFVTGPVTRPDIESHPIQEERFLCIVYEGHRLASRSRISLEDLADEDFVHGPAKDWEYFYYHLLPLCRRAGFMPRIVQEAYNSAGILGLVASRMGITILTESTGRSAIPGLVEIPIAGVKETLKTIAIWRAEDSGGAKKRFVDFLKTATPD
ncbi:LysR family transcriptional regulator [Rhodophyticola sp. CCM32]|uniref:LysR family transcriptional regulator n=1 Tax=Rhodophyticola sp. CCM32 TaxID=2916397 RepID=UPI00107F712A|nr:LysR family transcriptional regulator [Rhodophyticola sp. CCM32]QBY02246.1 LysR family transcriptional regulator [Rhodophyticola sp. CCM32]